MELSEKQKAAFFESVSRAAKKISEAVKEDRYIYVFSHLDADGIAAAGIVGKALYRLDAKFRVRITQWVDEKIADEILEEKPGMVIFTDLGSDYANLLRQKAPEMEIVVLDHHQTGGESDLGVFHALTLTFMALTEHGT
jgi:single-stranded DNA-specific DHH superfamily exonuclease